MCLKGKTRESPKISAFIVLKYGWDDLTEKSSNYLSIIPDRSLGPNSIIKIEMTLT